MMIFQTDAVPILIFKEPELGNYILPFFVQNSPLWNECAYTIPCSQMLMPSCRDEISLQ